MRTLLASVVLAAAIGLTSPGAHAEPSFFRLAFAIGSPGEDVGSVSDAGAVHLIPGDGTGHIDPAASITITRASIGGNPVAGDDFGAAVEVADLNDDNIADLIIGAPGIDRDAGRVYVIFFLPHQGRFDVAHPLVLQQGRDGLLGTSEPGDRFGKALHYTYAGSAEPYLAIGAPGEDVGGIVDAGAVTVVGDGTDLGDDAVYYQGSGLPGTAEKGDQFGFALAQFYTSLAVGAPGEDVGSTRDAGNVTALLRGNPDAGGEYHEGSHGVPGTAEAGDQFGLALASHVLNSVSIGVPGKDVGGVADAGAVVDLVFPGACCVRTTTWSEGADGLPGTPQAGDRFGASLGGTHSGALVVGVPGRDVGGQADAGLIQLIGEEEGGATLVSTGNVRYHQDSGGVPGTGEAGDRFGASIGQQTNVLLVGMPREDVHGSADAGAVVSLQLDGTSIVSGPSTRQITQDDLVGSRAEPGDHFGAALMQQS